MNASALLSLLMASSAWAADIKISTAMALPPSAPSWPSIDVQASVSTAALGVAVVLTAEVSHSGILKLDIAASTTDYFSILKVEEIDNSTKGPRTMRIEIVPLAVGRLAIPLVWDWDDSTVTSAPVILNVPEPQIQGPAEIRDIKEPRAARAALWPWLLALALAVLGWKLYKRFAPKALPPGQSPPVIDGRPAEIVAQSELDELEACALWAEGRFKEFYIRLTDILRRYLERRYEIGASHLTSSELHRHVRHAEIDRPIGLILRDIFDKADLVKFAKIAPAQDWGKTDLEAARSFVRLTAPQPMAPLEAAS
ncbi:MAG: hypothetical protein A3J74_03590 [Elusimicrobia bacterium RIFCSPHIGHO2_02_FULL_57_9]|nr:MAG: hypothetical protein A3J74_03590 [Elusimicrobia bacterium RIFCSPHIGHO2_02_FULL_57_9]